MRRRSYLAGRDQKAIDIHIDWDVHVQIDKAFECCDFMLKAAGGKGWSQVSHLPQSLDLPRCKTHADARNRSNKLNHITFHSNTKCRIP
jgi:hypothetical protein